MAAPISNTHIRAPAGFANLLEAVTKEILRYQPEDIYTFCYNYFIDLLKLRDETQYNLVELCARLEDRYYNNHAFKKSLVSYSDPLQNEAAIKIQSSYRRFKAKKDVNEMRKAVAASDIQSIYRAKKERRMGSYTFEQEKIKSESAIREEALIHSFKEQANNQATAIEPENDSENNCANFESEETAKSDLEKFTHLNKESESVTLVTTQISMTDVTDTELVVPKGDAQIQEAETENPTPQHIPIEHEHQITTDDLKEEEEIAPNPTVETITDHDYDDHRNKVLAPEPEELIQDQDDGEEIYHEDDHDQL